MVVSMAALEETNMRVAVLSGKGGTGKTLVSVNLPLLEMLFILTVMLRNLTGIFFLILRL